MTNPMLNYAFRAFGFLKVEYEGRSYNKFLYYIPLTISLFVTLFVYLINVSTKGVVNIFLEDAFSSLSTFTQVLPGFYIGSLAAIASYGYTGLDSEMSSPKAKIQESTTNGSRPSPLTRRRYLTIMFGYLASISMVLTILVFFVTLLYSIGVFPVAQIIFLTIYYLVVFIFFFIFIQMLLITFFGIYYLSDRMHR